MGIFLKITENFSKNYGKNSDTFLFFCVFRSFYFFVDEKSEFFKKEIEKLKNKTQILS